MLRESHSIKYAEKSIRRWFFDDFFDLIVWMDHQGSVNGFQLCYDKQGNERAFTWTGKSGYSHERVDNGETNPSKNLTPILIPDGIGPAEEIVELFLAKSTLIDASIRMFIIDKLREYKCPCAGIERGAS
jgi:hypothetical protein